jgi:hypothetical protein
MGSTRGVNATTPREVLRAGSRGEEAMSGFGGRKVWVGDDSCGVQSLTCVGMNELRGRVHVIGGEAGHLANKNGGIAGESKDQTQRSQFIVFLFGGEQARV